MSTGATHFVSLLFFAKSRELAGISEARLEIKSDTRVRCVDLLQEICQRHNLLDIKKNVILAINGEYKQNLDEIVSCATITEIAVIPPISGG